MHGGTPTPVPFLIGSSVVETLNEGHHKFLGSQIFFSGKTSEVFNFIKDDVNTKLQRIDALLIRPEYKLSIYSRYLLPSIRFMLTVHTLQKSHLDSLDTLTDGYVKKWLGIPSRGANIALVHIPQGLDIPRLSDLYWKSQCSAYSRSRLLADDTVNHALDCSLERESKWTTKQSTVTICQSVHERVMAHENSDNPNWNVVKRNINQVLYDDSTDFWKRKIEPLLIQGKFAELLLLQNENLTWKSIIYNLPRKVLSFAINASIDSLPSYSNLHRWGKRLSDKCKFCPNTTGTLHHILAFCPLFLERYTWRHNSILKFIYDTILEHGEGFTNMFCDLEGYTIGGGTIPPHILVSNKRPDLVVVWNDPPKILLFELSVPFESNIQDAHDRKVMRYEELIRDLDDGGHEVIFNAVEIGQRGFIDKNNQARLKETLRICNCTRKPKEVIHAISKISLLSSFIIFNSRREQSWSDPKLLTL